MQANPQISKFAHWAPLPRLAGALAERTLRRSQDTLAAGGKITTIGQAASAACPMGMLLLAKRV